jgi:transposase-like protein
MSQHHGQAVEKIIRRGGHSITKVARIMNVNRRSVYNWFDQVVLRQEIKIRLHLHLKNT